MRTSRRAWTSGAALHLGGFIGPLGGGIVGVLLPELAASFHASIPEVAASIPAYLVPFALLQVVSGTIGERLGRARVIRAGYAAYALTSLAAGLAPGLGWFLGLRAAQGAVNAFLTPLLLAAVAEAASPGRLGRSVGTFAAVQTAGTASAPLFGGLAGEVHWRLAFVLTAVVATALAAVPVPGGTPARAGGPARMRALLDRRVAVLCAAALLNFVCVPGLSFLVALRAADEFGLGSTGRGLLVAGFGVAGMGAGRVAGTLADRGSPVLVACAATLACAPLVAVLGVTGSVGVLAAAWAAAGLACTGAWAGLNTLIISAVPSNRGGAASVVSAGKFLGSSLAPVLWLPLYDRDAALAFLAASAVAVLAGLAVLPLRRP